MRRLAAPSLVLSVLCLVAVPGAASAKTVELTSKANGTTVTLRKGDALKVALRGESGSTGYAWKVTRRSAQSILRSRGSRYVADDLEPGAVGGGGTRTYTWKAAGTGTTSTRLALIGPGRDRAVGKRFRLTIRVR